MTQTNPFQHDENAPKVPIILPKSAITDRVLRDPALPVTIEGDLVPFDRDGMYIPNELDGDEVVHFFAAAEDPNHSDGAPTVQLNYYRAAVTRDERLVFDAHPVMPLETAEAYPFPRETLETMLMDHDLENAQELAYQTARSHGLAFPEPESLPAFNRGVDYRFEGAIDDDGSPAVAAVKAWREGDSDREQRITVETFGIAAEADVTVRELDAVQAGFGLQTAMNLAERMAVAGGHLDGERADGRLFNEGPADPFTTVRERELEAEHIAHETPHYSVDAVSANGVSHLNVSKTWGDDGHAHLIIPQLTWDEAMANAQAAHDMMLADDLEGAMTLVEIAGVEAGVIDLQRFDTRLFTEGPDDPFTTIREREINAADMDTQELPAVAPANPFSEWAEEREDERTENASLQGAAWFEATFEGNPEIDLLEPVDNVVNYAVVVTDTDPWTTELLVEKFWREPGGYVGSDTLTIDTFDSDDETAREQAQADRAALLEVHEQRGLQAMMWRAELDAIENGHLEKDRENLHLFRHGPYDNFETLAQRLDGEVNPYWNTSGEQIDSPSDETQDLPPVEPEPGSWDELVAEQRDQVEPEPTREAHYWQMHYRPVETPDGEPLGTALFVTEFPELPPNFDEYIDEFGMDDTVYPTEARTLEMAHFASEDDARKFDDEFRSYLVPDLLDGPELAPEVAKLEGLSGEWQDMNYNDIVGYMSGHRTIVRDADDWHLHDPHAEREAREQVEGVMALQDEDEPSPEHASPDLDL